MCLTLTPASVATSAASELIAVLDIDSDRPAAFDETDEKRLPAVLNNTSGFVYYVSITGITGAATPDGDKVGAAVAAIKAKTDLPVTVGFGVSTPEQAAEIAKVADGVVVGSAIIRAVVGGLTVAGEPKRSFQKDVIAVVKKLANGVKRARK